MDNNLIERIIAGFGEALYKHAKEAVAADEAAEAVEYLATNILKEGV